MEIKREQRTFKVDEIVKTRSDIGSIMFKITQIHNDYYCTAKQIFKFGILGHDRHFNMDVFDKIEAGELFRLT